MAFRFMIHCLTCNAYLPNQLTSGNGDEASRNYGRSVWLREHAAGVLALIALLSLSIGD